MIAGVGAGPAYRGLGLRGKMVGGWWLGENSLVTAVRL